jgi:SagB-type dehydrogenase family enzyme
MGRFRRRVLIGRAVLVALACVSAGCDSQPVARSSAKQEPVRPLNELPVEQLRAMLKGYDGDWRADSDASRDVPEPPAAKPIPADAKRVPLIAPTKLSLGSMSLREAIATRRSARDFSKAALSGEELSFLLWATQGVTAVERDDAGNVSQQFRAAPSAGGRYPLETYVAVARVNGFAPGVYRYVPSTHELVIVREDAGISAKARAACYDQAFVGDAAVVFVWTAVPYRTEWKYAYLSHRMIAAEAGHVAENLYLAAASCGAGICAMMAYQQQQMDALIGAGGVDEFTLYVACVGKPAPGAR